MRRILVDAARKRSTSKHGGGLERLNVEDVLSVTQTKDGHRVAFDDALSELRQVEARCASIVELRYFGGLSVKETAATLGISEETVTRNWRLARGWLLAQVARAETQHLK